MSGLIAAFIIGWAVGIVSMILLFLFLMLIPYDKSYKRNSETKEKFKQRRKGKYERNN